MTDTPFDLNAPAGFAPVIDAFKDNFAQGQEHGAAFCVVKDGRVIVDLIGGWADRAKTQSLTQDHLMAVFSSGKAVASLVIANMVDDDLIGYNQTINTIWPEFDTHGKGDLTVAQIMSHQSGLSGITNTDWKPEDWLDWDKTCAELAAQAPIFPPGSSSGYHPGTFGYLAGEIARRSDPHGRSIGRIIREEWGETHGLDIWIGLPESEHHRCAKMHKPRKMADLGEMNAPTQAAFMQPWSNAGRVDPAAWRIAEMPGSNCFATARSLARLMQMAVDGSVGGEQFLYDDTLEHLRTPVITGPDLVLPFTIAFTPGLMRNDPNFFYGPNADTIGHSGWGGSCVFADPVAGISVAYVMTQQDNSLMGDPRSLKLIDALYASL